MLKNGFEEGSAVITSVRDIQQHSYRQTKHRSLQDTSARAKKGLTDTPVRTSFLGLTCLFGLQGLFGFMPHGLAVLLEFVVACLFPWSRTDFQKISAIHQELQVPITLQTCGEDKSKTAHVTILLKLILKDRFVGYFPQHPFYEGRTNKKRIVLSLCGLIEEGTHPFMSPAAEEENVAYKLLCKTQKTA